MRKPEDIIHDLEAIKILFEESTNGCSPMCLSEAIDIIKGVQIKETTNDDGRHIFQ